MGNRYLIKKKIIKTKSIAQVNVSSELDFYRQIHVGIGY